MKWWASRLATIHSPLSPGECYQNITVNTGGAGELTFHTEDSPREKSDNPIHFASDWLKSVTQFWLMRNENKLTKQCLGKVFLFLKWKKKTHGKHSPFSFSGRCHMYILHLKLWQPSGYRLRLKPAWEMAEQRCGRNLGSGWYVMVLVNQLLLESFLLDFLLKPVSVSLWQNNFLCGKYCWLPLQYFLSFSSLPWEPHFFFFFFFPPERKGQYTQPKMFSLQISFQLEMTLILATEIQMKSSEWGLGETFWIGIGFFYLLTCLSYLEW